MSYHRADVNLTEKLVDYCTYVVREEEADEYRANGHNNLLTIPQGAAHDFTSTFYWIINNTPEDIICILDDDIKNFVWRMDKFEKIGDDEEGREIVTTEIERQAQLLVDLDLGFSFCQIGGASYTYNQEFAFKGMPGPVRWINKSAFKAKYDPNDEASGDIDIAMQELLRNRIVLMEKYFIAKASQNEILGAKEELRHDDHVSYVHAMKTKWGRYYSYNWKKNEASINVQR